MCEYFFGLIMGFLLCVVLHAAVDVDDRKEAVKSGWIKIGGEVYTLRKADVVDAAEEVK